MRQVRACPCIGPSVIVPLPAMVLRAVVRDFCTARSVSGVLSRPLSATARSARAWLVRAPGFAQGIEDEARHFAGAEDDVALFVRLRLERTQVQIGGEQLEGGVQVRELRAQALDFLAMMVDPPGDLPVLRHQAGHDDGFSHECLPFIEFRDILAYQQLRVLGCVLHNAAR